MTFGGATATGVLVGVGLQVTTPPHAAGTVDIVVTGSTGSTKVGGAFTYYTENGDVNSDGVVSVADVFYLINFLFAGGTAPLGPADVNGDGAMNVSDIFYLINHLFAGGSQPV